MFLKIITITLFFFAIFFISQKEVLACSCMPKPTVLDEFERSQTVVIAKVVSVEKVKDTKENIWYKGIKSVKAKAEKVYKGDILIGKELIFRQGIGADCLWTFEEDDVGKRFLFYLNEPSKGHPFFSRIDEDSQIMYDASICGRSGSVDYSFDDLSYLNNIEKVRDKTRISGMLVGLGGGNPNFANTNIKIIGKKRTYTIKTDKNGFYEIYGLPAGRYLIEPEIPKEWRIIEFMLQNSSSYDENGYGAKNQFPIILKEKSHAGLDLIFEKMKN